MSAPLPWERLLWSGRPSAFAAPRAIGERYVLTDFRLVRVRRAAIEELALDDIRHVHRDQSRIDRLLGTSSLTVTGRNARGPTIVLHGIRRGPQLAALLELLANDPTVRLDAAAVGAALSWQPDLAARRGAESAAAVGVVAIAIAAVAIGLHGRAADITYGPDDPVYPNGVRTDRNTIVQFMKAEVMPWARTALGPLLDKTDGADRVRCETCHGKDAAKRDWRMPGVAALPQPDVKERGWERYGDQMDAQMRNAIYGYAAQSDKQAKATYMREVVMPGMARLLHRQPYDFTQPYEFNRRRAAFGCYHCHKVK